MRSVICTLIIGAAHLILAAAASAQADDICREFGETPTREVGRQNRLAPYVYGRIIIAGLTSTAKPPRVTVIYSDNSQPATRQTVSKSGNYCFRRVGNGGMLVVDVDGVEVARKSLSDLGGSRTREDFEVLPNQPDQLAPPGVVSTKFSRPTNDKTIDLYRKAAEAEREKKLEKTVEYVKEIVSIDPDDFIAWAKLASLYLERKLSSDAEAAFKKCLEIRTDYTPAMLNLGMMYAFQNQFPEAIEMFKRAVATDPNSARGYRLLGEAYLQNRQGSLGLATLDKALEIDPVGMAECHLLKARLYDLVGAKQLAAAEYKAFLKKVPDHPEKKILEKYIRDNPA